MKKEEGASSGKQDLLGEPRLVNMTEVTVAVQDLSRRGKAELK